jgi:hypothetical protein
VIRLLACGRARFIFEIPQKEIVRYVEIVDLEDVMSESASTSDNAIEQAVANPRSALGALAERHKLLFGHTPESCILCLNR